MISKSNNILRYCIIVTIICNHLLSISTQNDLSVTINNYKKKEILNDLPSKSDLADYVQKLEKILNFASKYERYVDLNFGFGLFLVKVNLRTIVKMRAGRIPENLMSRLNMVLNNTDNRMKYFRNMVDNDQSETKSSAQYITNLFTKGDQRWALHLQAFKTDLIKKTTFYYVKDLRGIYSNWSDYVEKVNDFDQYVPTPQISNECISSLSQIPINPTMQWKTCEVSDICRGVIRNGTDYGYGITHRLLFILMARFSRGCTLISASADKQRIDQFCAKIYNELEYHNYHNFQLPDLSLEIISLCTLEGHAQFLRYSWLKKLFKYQRDIGCFASSIEGKELQVNDEIYKEEKKVWELTVEDQEILRGACNTHTSGVAAAALSATIRYIIEKFI